jgi:uncharacterized membrane protein YoaK (UPF0700 family)
LRLRTLAWRASKAPDGFKGIKGVAVVNSAKTGRMRRFANEIVRWFEGVKELQKGLNESTAEKARGD